MLGRREFSDGDSADYRRSRKAGADGRSVDGSGEDSPLADGPAGRPAQGRVTNRLALEGFAVIQDYEQQRDGRANNAGHGIFRDDGAAGQYVLHWFDSLSFPPAEFRGTFDGGVMILTIQSSPGHSRATFDFRTDDEFAFQMEILLTVSSAFGFWRGVTSASNS